MAFLETKFPAPFLALAIAAAMRLQWHELDIPDPAWEPRVIVAVALSLASAALVLAAVTAFGRARTTINPLYPERAAVLVTHGVYRFTRNPMYLSLLLLLLAYAIRLGPVAALAGPTVYAIYVTRFQVLPEERVLHAKFGEQYADYCRRVRRWL